MTSAFTVLFVAALVAVLATRLWLALRQMAHVQRHRERVPEAFADRIGLAAHQKAADYTTAKQKLGRVETVVDALVLFGLTLGGGLALLLRWTGGLGVGPLWQDVALFAGLAIVSATVSLPFSWYSTFVVEERFGFNRMTLGLWLADLAKGAAVAVALGLPLLVLALWLMRAAGPHWWLWTWTAWMAFQLLVLVLYPTVIAPLFNKFEPLPAGSARARIEALLARCGFSSAGLFVMDGSRRSGHGNAYFTGLGHAKRVVFFDTLLARLDGDELEAVLAHELGHFKLRHIAKRIAVVGRRLARVPRPARLAGRQAVVLRGPRHTRRPPPRGPRASGRGARAVRARAAGVHVRARPARGAVFAPPRVRGRRVRRPHLPADPRSCARWSSSTRTTPRRSRRTPCTRRSTIRTRPPASASRGSRRSRRRPRRSPPEAGEGDRMNLRTLPRSPVLQVQGPTPCPQHPNPSPRAR